MTTTSLRLLVKDSTRPGSLAQELSDSVVRKNANIEAIPEP
ncbi:hypothetical protein ACIQU7_10785 [Streptomyces albidoflavus]